MSLGSAHSLMAPRKQQQHKGNKTTLASMSTIEIYETISIDGLQAHGEQRGHWRAFLRCSMEPFIEPLPQKPGLKCPAPQLCRSQGLGKARLAMVRPGLVACRNSRGQLVSLQAARLVEV